MNAKQICHVLILSAGTMGQQIALLCAWHGYQVVLYDLSPEILEQAIARITGLISCRTPPPIPRLWQ